MADHYPLYKKITLSTGVYPRTLIKTLAGIPRFLVDWRRYQALNRGARFQIRIRNLFPILTDRKADAGMADGHYFHQDLWAARKVYGHRPTDHIDVGSRVDGFVAHLLVFMPVTIIDIRQLDSKVSGLVFRRDDATQLRAFETGSVESLSSLHAAEHFGLGRYGDPIDPGACFKFMNALQRVLKVGGRLIFSVPVGRERVEFNAHRVFAPQTIIEAFQDLRLVSFGYVGDDGDLRENASVTDAAKCVYGCGLFEFTKDVR